MPTNREAGSSTTRAGSGGLQRFRDACSKVIRHLRGERSLREAARLHAPGGAEAHALLRRACSFGFTELACAPAEELVGDVHRPTFHLAPANCWINDPNGACRAAGALAVGLRRGSSGLEFLDPSRLL